MAAFDFGLLQGMPQDQAIPLLQQLLASGQLSPLGAAPLTGMPGYSGGPTGEGDFGTPLTPGQGQWLTPDGTYNGQEGAYVGQFNGGQLQNAYFDPKEAYGFMDQWGGPLAIAGAALGGAALNGGFGAGAGAATDVGVNSAIAGGMDGGAALGGAGGIGGAPISASVPSFTAGGAAAGGAGGIGSVASGIGGIGQLAGSAIGAGLGGLSALTAPDSQTTTQTRGTDPRIDQAIFGQLYPQLQQQMAQGPSNGLQGAFNISDEFLSKGQGGNTWNAINNASMNQIGSNLQAPGMQAAQAQGVGYDGRNAMNAASLRDPSQQGTNLQPGFDQYIYGDQGANPYLQGALQRGGDQARSNFGSLLQDMSQNFSENVLGNIRGGAIQAGGYGGSRQGLAEGIAGRGFAQAASRAAENYGRDLNSTMVGGQSANFMQGRGLGAGLLGGLSGQQYGQEQQRAGFQQGANQTNAGLGYQGAALGQQNNQFNANLMQGAGANNLQSQLSTQGLNANIQNQGIGNAWNQFRGATDLANANSNFGFNRTLSGMQAFAPYAQMYGTQQTQQPLYNNPWSSALAGGLAGAQLGRIWS